MAIQTIGAGRDYSTFADWRTFLGTVDEPYTRSDIGEMYDAEAPTSDQTWDRPVWTTGTGGVCELRGAVANRHPGYINTSKAGFYRSDGTTGSAFLAYPGNMSAGSTTTRILRALGLSRTGTAALNALALRSDPDGGPHVLRISECVIFLDTTSTSANAFACETNNSVGFGDTTLIFDNCLFISNSQGGCLQIDMQLAGLRVYNCVFLSTASAGTPKGLHVTLAPSGTYEIRNCYAATTSGYASFRPFELAGTPTFTNNVSGGGNASFQADDVTGASACFAGELPADYFTLTDIATGVAFRKAYSGGGVDRLTAGGVLLDADYRTDIKGNARGAVTPDIGAEQFGVNTPPQITLGAVERNVGGSFVTQSAPYQGLWSNTWRFNATAFDAEQGTISSSIAWEADTGSGFVSIGTGAQITWVAPGTTGTATIRATITDSSSVSDSDTFTISTKSIIANAGSDIEKAGADPLVRLSGSATNVGMGGVFYSWSQVSGTTVVLNASNTATPYFRAPAVQSTQSPLALVFEFTVSNGVDSATDRVTVSLLYGQQQALFIMRSVAQRMYDLRVRWRTTDGFNLALWAQTRNRLDWTPPADAYPSDHIAAGYPSGAGASIGAFGLEDGATCATPNATFSGANGAPAILAGLAECYRATGIAFFRDRALEFGSSISAVFGYLQYWQDCAVYKVGSYASDGAGLTGVVLPNDSEAGVLLGSSRRGLTPTMSLGTTNEAYWGSWNADEGAVGAGLASLLQLHRALRTRGDSIPSWLLDGHAGLPHANGIKGVIQTYITLADTDFGDGGLGVRKPYATGGFPEVYPLSKAFTINVNGNLGNLWKSYMQDKMVQDNAMASMMSAFGLALSEFTASGDAMLSAVQTFFNTQVDWLLDRMVAYAADDVYGVCGQYGIGPTIYEPSAYYDLDEPSFGRPQDHRGVLVGETGICALLCWLYRITFTQAADKLRISDFGGASPVGALPFYLDKMRGTSSLANDNTIPAFPVQADGQWYRTYPYPDDEHLAAATTALGATPQIVFCISTGSGASTIRKIGYDTIEGITPVDTSNPDFNIGFVEERGGQVNGAGIPSSPPTAEGGQVFYFGAGNCDSTERTLLSDAATGKLLESKVLTHRNYIDDGGTFFISGTWNSSVNQALAAYLPDQSGWLTSDAYNSTTNGAYLAKLALGYAAMPNTPPLYDSDGDGTPDSGPSPDTGNRSTRVEPLRKKELFPRRVFQRDSFL